MSGTEYFWYQLALTVASVVYQRYRARKAQAASDAAADKQKGFQLVTENTAQPIPIAYGRFKIGGTRVYHKISNDYIYSTPPSINSNIFLSTGDIKTPNIGIRSGEITVTRIRFSGDVTIGSGESSYIVRQTYDSGIVSVVINLLTPSRDITLPSGGWNVDNTVLRANLLDRDFTLEYGSGNSIQLRVTAVGPSESYVTVENSIYIDTGLGGSLSQTITNTKREFLYLQQTLSFGNLSKIVYVDVDDKPFDHTDYSYGQRIHVHYNGSVADPLATANGIPSTNLFTGIAYATGVFRLNRDDPNYNGIPTVTSYGEGVLVKPITSSSSIGSTAIYSNNQAELILDYLMSPLYGRGVALSKIDLPSFYKSKQICDKIVQSINTPYGDGADINGKYWKEKFREWKETHTTGDIFTRNLHLYEFNGIIDTGVPLRDNFEVFLQSIGLAELIWSGGKYKLKICYATPYTTPGTTYYDGDIVQYDNPSLGYPELWRAVTTTSNVPGSSANWVQEHVAVITDDELDQDSQMSISWPTLQNKLNRCTVNFLNEAKDFDEDSISWPARNGVVHLAYLAEDNSIALEKSLFANGCSDVYHAKAIAEQEVRLSRDMVVYNFSLSPRWSGLEPGDVIVIKSSRLGIPGELIKIESVRLKENVFVEIQAIKFDARMLAWNTKSEEVVTPRNVYNYKLKQATGLAFTETGALYASQSGVLTWNAPDDNRIRSYNIMYTTSSIYEVGENTVWQQIGTTTTTRFETPHVPAGAYTLAVVSVGFDGTLAPRLDFLSESRWPVINCVISATLDDGIPSVKLTSDNFMFITNSALVTTPSTITLTAHVTDIVGPIYEWKIDGVIQVGETTDTFVLDSFPATAGKSVSVEVTAPGGIFVSDDMVIYSLQENGQIPYILYTRSNAIVPADADGNNENFTEAYTNLSVYRGTVNETALWSFSKSDLGTTSTLTNNITYSYYNLAVTAMAADVGAIIVTASKSGEVSLNNTFSLTKIRNGFDGDTAQTLILSYSRPNFIYENENATHSLSPDILFAAKIQNIPGVPVFVAEGFDASGVSLGAISLSGSGNTRTMSASQFEAVGSTVKYASITVTLETFSDLTYIARTDNGSNGLLLELTNPAHAVSTESDGTGGDYSLAYTEVKVLRGSDYETGLWTFTRSNTNTSSLFSNSSSTIGPGEDPIYLAVTNLSQVTGKVTITATKAGDPTLVRDFILAKAKAGANSQLLVLKASGIAFIFANPADTSSTATPSITFTARLLGGLTGAVIFTAEGFNSAGTSLGTIPLNTVSDTEATMSDVQFVNSLGTAVRTAVVTATIGTLEDEFTVYRYDTGDSNYRLVFVDGGSLTILTDSAGNNGDYTNAHEDAVLARGDTNDTANWTYSIVATGCTATINGGAGPVANPSTVTVAITNISALNAKVVLTATQTGAPTQTATLKVVKSIAGTSAFEHNLIPSSCTLNLDEYGKPSSYLGANSEYTVTQESVDVTDDWTFNKSDINCTSTLNGGSGPVGPSVAPILLAITDVVAVDPDFNNIVCLLNCDETSGTPVDGSNYANIVTLQGTVTQSNTQPLYGGHASYITREGSDTPTPSGIKITPASLSAWAMGTADWTISMMLWKDLTVSLQGDQFLHVVGQIVSGGSYNSCLTGGVNSGNINITNLGSSPGSIDDMYSYMYTFDSYRWTKFQVCRRGGTIEYWINDRCLVVSEIASPSTTLFNLSEIYLGRTKDGASASKGFGGYIGGFSVIRGVATPRSYFYESDSSNVILNVSPNTNMLDSSSYANPVTNYSNMLIKSPYSAYGSKYMGMAGLPIMTNGGLLAPLTGANSGLCTGDFTLEIVGKFIGSSIIFHSTVNDTYAGASYLYGGGILSVSGVALTLAAGGTTYAYNTSVATPQQNYPTIHEIAISRTGSTIGVYYRGKKIGQGTHSGDFDFRQFKVGEMSTISSGGATNTLHCVRITKGVGRHTNDYYNAWGVTPTTSHIKRASPAYVNIIASKSGAASVTKKFTINRQNSGFTTETEYSYDGVFGWHKIPVSTDEWARDRIIGGVWGVPYRFTSYPTVLATLSSSGFALPATNDGVVTSFAGCTTTLTIVVNGIDDTANWSYSHTTSHASITPTTGTSRTVTVTGMDSAVDTGTVTLVATKTGFPTQTMVFNITKNKGSTQSGPQGISLSNLYSANAYLSLRFTTNGGILYKKISGGSWLPLANWYFPNITSIGNSFWLKVVELSGDPLTTNPASTYTNITSNLDIVLDRGSAGTSLSNLRLYLADNSTGTANVTVATVSLEVVY